MGVYWLLQNATSEIIGRYGIVIRANDRRCESFWCHSKPGASNMTIDGIIISKIITTTSSRKSRAVCASLKGGAAALPFFVMPQAWQEGIAQCPFGSQPAEHIG